MTTPRPFFPRAQRVSNPSDSKLYSFGVVPAMDRKDQDYILTLTVRAADPATEQGLADYCTKAINAAPKTLRALRAAHAKLDSVAFLAQEGDTDVIKQDLLKAIAQLVDPVDETQQAEDAIEDRPRAPRP